MSWQVDFWDVGQGDATSIKLPTGEYVLIDTGPGATSNNPIVQWFCHEPAAFTISAVAITHNDEDHVGGLHALATDPALKIQTVYLVNDPKTKGSDPRFAKLMNPLRARSMAGRTQTLTLQSGTILAQDDELQLIARHPDFISAHDAISPNKASSLLSLECKDDGRVLIVWGGDALLETIGTVYKGRAPCVLVGPHHGAPQDRPSSSIKYAKKLDTIAPHSLFVSLGSSNRHDHPKRDYLVGAAKKSIGICCTQITQKCFRETQKPQPVFQGSARLGLPAPRRSVPCRGAMRVFASPDGIEYDEYQSQYTSALGKVDRALCKR